MREVSPLAKPFERRFRPIVCLMCEKERCKRNLIKQGAKKGKSRKAARFFEIARRFFAQAKGVKGEVQLLCFCGEQARFLPALWPPGVVDVGEMQGHAPHFNEGVEERFRVGTARIAEKKWALATQPLSDKILHPFQQIHYTTSS